MKLTFLLVLVVVFGVLHESNGAWIRRTWRRIKHAGRRVWKVIKPAVKAWVIKKGTGLILAAGKRDVSEFDTNMDGVVDQSELETVMNTRDAEELLEAVSDDGNAEVTTEELDAIFRSLREIQHLNDLEIN